MSEPRKTLRQQLREEADQLATIEHPTFGQESRWWWLEVALFWRIPELVEWLNAKLTRTKGGGEGGA